MDKQKYILDKLFTEQNQIIKNDKYTNFFLSLKDYTIEQRFEIIAKIAIRGNKLGFDDIVISNCKIHLKTKAFSGITASITEKNINYVYELINKYSN